MDSVITKSNNYTMIGNQAIAGVVLLPEASGFRVYVAWEFENQAKRKIFAIIESHEVIGSFPHNWIEQVADYGNEVTHSEKAKKLFPKLF